VDKKILHAVVAGESGTARKLDLKVGFRCNNHCTFCVQGDKRDHTADLTTDEVKQRLENARAQCDRLVLTGGEATIRDDIPEIAAYHTIQLQTNGRRMAYRKYCETLIEAGVNRFNPSVHGHNASLHDKLTGTRGAFDQCVRGIQNLVALKQIVLTQTVIVRDNVAHLPDIAQVLVQLGVTQAQFAFVHAIGTAAATWDQTVPRYADVAPQVAKAVTRVRAAHRIALTEAIPFCFLHGNETAACELRTPSTMVYDGDITIGDYGKYRLTEGKAHGEVCARCTWNGRCEGPWREYPAHFGWNEFVARTDPPLPCQD
jgi:MoaA/NifB/PqqE/SkfB family radical SAM enzyme